MMKRDVERGEGIQGLMLESPQLRWSFIRKVYSIIAFQLLLTIAVASVVVSVHPIAHFFVASTAGLPLFIVLVTVPFISQSACYTPPSSSSYLLRFTYIIIISNTLSYSYLFLCHVDVGCSLMPPLLLSPETPSQSLPSFNLHRSLAFAIGLTCAFTSGKVILESVILTTVVVLSLTLYTFWAARRGHDFNFLGPFLFGAVLVLLVFALIQILFPLGKLTVMIYGCLASIIFCGYIIYDTDNLIKRFSYDEYIWASVSLYLDIINLFLALLTVFRAVD